MQILEFLLLMVATDNLKHVTVTLFFWKMPFDQENR